MSKRFGDFAEFKDYNWQSKKEFSAVYEALPNEQIINIIIEEQMSLQELSYTDSCLFKLS